MHRSSPSPFVSTGAEVQLMKVRLVGPIRETLARLKIAIDPATGRPWRYRSIAAWKAACKLEDLVAEYLEQDPENPGSNRLKFLCFGHADTNPSLYVNVEQQRWGCEAGCF